MPAAFTRKKIEKKDDARFMAWMRPRERQKENGKSCLRETERSRERVKEIGRKRKRRRIKEREMVHTQGLTHAQSRVLNVENVNSTFDTACDRVN